MTDTFRALCAELVETWDATADFDFNDFGNVSADIVKRARAALAQPEPVWTEGICGDGAAILKDGVMQPIEDVIAALNATPLLSGAAVLRAAADQVVPVTPAPNDTFCCPPVATIVWKRLACVRAELLAIADELEGQP